MKNVTQKEVENIKLLLTKGLTAQETAGIVKRDKSTVQRVARGCYDNRFNKPVEKTEKPPLTEIYDLLWQALELLEKVNT